MAEQNTASMLKLLNDAAPIVACGIFDLARAISAAQASGREVRITVVFCANGQITMEHPQVIDAKPATEQGQEAPGVAEALEPQADMEAPAAEPVADPVEAEVDDAPEAAPVTEPAAETEQTA